MKNIQDILTRVKGYFDLTSIHVGDVVEFDDFPNSYYFLGVVTGFEQYSRDSEAGVIKILSFKEGKDGPTSTRPEELKLSPVAAWKHCMKVIGTAEELEDYLQQLDEKIVNHSEVKEHPTPWTPTSEGICDKDGKLGKYSISTVVDRDISSFKEELLRTLNSDESSRSLVNMSMVSREMPYVAILIFKEN